MNVFYKTILDMTNQFFLAIILRMTKVEINDGKNSQTMLIVALDMDSTLGLGRVYFVVMHYAPENFKL